MEAAIKKILEVAVHAPSGHNFQPWKFQIKNNTIHIFNIPDRDTTLYNFEQAGSYMAHGALIENILIASSATGYTADLTLFPEINQQNLVATIILKPSSSQVESLYPHITERVTTRKPYQKIPLKPEHKSEILKIGNIALIEDQKQKEELAEAFALNELLLFENYHMHQSLFPHILWTQEENEKMLGLYIKTFELPPPIQGAFKLFAHWPVAKFVKAIGFPKVVAMQNKKLYASASAIGLITTSGKSPKDFILAGRTMQRMWLTATQLGMSVHPVTAIIHLGHRVRAGYTQRFSPAQVKLIHEAYNTISSLFGITTETMAMTFRIGYADQPTARSSKLPPDYVLS